ncbi:putative glucose dehydrogenase [Schizothecium vesticola]|uniref:Glucose dehydrogenase n=1 Tax=Schizothecium vesticola TaxID=314040 RepID=A0AA40F2Q3_9PEZI|nr:putative glucose dehydrogenase [Schizothecium vesticola]
MASEYDFIIVGSGPAGSAIAYRLGQSPKKPKVLLLEAGGPNDDRNLRVDGQRWLTFMNKDLNWGYQTVPQKDAADRPLDYSRGKGLGGSSAINFGVFTIGAEGDYEEWARVVGDEAFSWKQMQSRMKKLETFHRELPAGINASKYAAPRAEDHGSSGPLHVGYANEWESNLLPVIDVFEQAGYPLNLDHNSGNPIGMSVLVSSAHNGVRSTARDLLLQLPDNVVVKTNSTVRRLILDGTKVIGVETSTGARHLACKEVILSAGSLDNPRILMHSGIGPADQLTKHSIPIVLPAPAIGQNLRDHAFTPLVYKRTPASGSGRAQFYGTKNQPVMDAALEQWKRDGTGPWAKYACELAMGYFKLPGLVASPEFRALPAAEQAYLNRPTVPHYEIITHFPIHWFLPGFKDEDLDYAAFLVFLYNAQARGSVTLQSGDPEVPLRYDPAFLSTEFDRRMAVEALRDVLRFTQVPAWAKDTVGVIAAPPADATDEELLGYWAQTISSSWHMTGTVKMGAEGDGEAAVDVDFRLRGVEGVRVADMSVVPVLASGHTQAVAYVTGWTCADKIIKEYGLE